MTSLLQKKYKILALCDHPLSTSGVGVQARFLFEGLVKTGRYSFKVLGGAVKHENYETVAASPDFIVKPVDGFGTPQLLRQLLITEQPDALFLFTDPRQFIWVWEMEDEIKQVCPIVYWHVWDNDPYPDFNKVWYDGTEAINCLSYKTYEMLKESYDHSEKVSYIPHSFPKSVYFPIPEVERLNLVYQNFKDKSDWFKVLWVNRNAHRKMPNDLLMAWKLFLDAKEKGDGNRNAVLIMHTDPNDVEGPNLQATSQRLGISDNVWFSTNRIQFSDLNILYNIVDCTVNISKAEGFGLSILSSLQCGTPVIGLKTGGMTRQLIDHRTNKEVGIALDPIERSMIGSQMVPYIYEDIVSKLDLVAAFWRLSHYPTELKKEIAQKGLEYVDFEFNYENMIKSWDESFVKTIENFQTNKPQQWDVVKLGL